MDDGLLRADVKPILYWLRLLQKCHAGYTHLQLPCQAQQDRTQVQLRELQTKIIAGAQRVHNRLSRTIERRATVDIAAVLSLPEDHDLEDNDCPSGSDLSESDSGHSEDESPEIDVDDHRRQPVRARPTGIWLSRSFRETACHTIL